MARSEDKRQQSNYHELFAIFILALALITPSIPFLCPSLLDKIKLDIWSNFGEYVGGMGGTLLSFAGVLLILQSIKYQRQEMREIRRIHEEQQFEVTFFQALNGHNELVKSFEMPISTGRTVSGRMCLRQLYRDFAEQCKKERVATSEQMFACFRTFADMDQLILNQFLQSIKELVSYTYRAKVQPKVKRDLLGFINAQLTYHEEFFFLLYLASTEPTERLVDFVKEHRIFTCKLDEPFIVLNGHALFLNHT